MANQNLTADIVIKAGLAEFKNETPFLQGINRQYDRTFEVAGAKQGDSVRIQQPKEFTMRSGKVASAQDNIEQSVTLATTRQRGVDVEFTSAELGQDISEFTEQFIKPAMATLASGIEFECLTDAYQQVYNQVGTPGTDPATGLVYGQAKSMLTSHGCPQANRSVVLNPNGNIATVDGLSGKFNDSNSIRNQFLTGDMGRFGGFDFAETVNVNTHTVGSSDGAYLLDANVTEGDTSLSVDTGTGTLKKGDILTIASIESVNPLNKKTTGNAMTVVVTADFAGGAGTIAISPALKASGPTQNVTALPLNNATVIEIGTASTGFAQNLAYHKDAFAIATLDLPMYGQNEFESRMNFDGISMRLSKVVDGVQDTLLYRFDILYGFVTTIPRYATRIWGA